MQKFCSDLCFQRSVYFGRQLSSEPLWMRAKGKTTVARLVEEPEELYGLLAMQ